MGGFYRGQEEAHGEVATREWQKHLGIDGC
jgi:hypothetical protein